MIAEEIRAYMADLNYLKTVAPRTAVTIGKFVNYDPCLNKIIQFNSVAVPVGIAMMNGDFKDDRLNRVDVRVGVFDGDAL